MIEKSDLFLYVLKNWKRFFLEESFTHNLNSCNKHKNNHVLSFPLFQKSACIKKIKFVSWEKYKSILIWEKFRFASHKDANPFLFEKNSDLHLRKMQIYFCIEKNSDLHLGKMQICLCIEKNLDLHQMKM